MSDLAIIGLCSCETEHTISVPDEAEVRTQEPLKRVVCGKCSATVEELKIVGSVGSHTPKNTELAASVI